jgi:hypothetical protein
MVPAATASAGGAVTFTLINGTGLTMVAFHASPPQNDDWEEDILGDAVLPAGYSVDVTIADGRDDCAYDLLAVFDAGDQEIEVTVEDAEVCDGSSYTFHN